MYTLEELAKEVGYKSMSYLRKLCRQNLTEGLDYEVSKVKTKVFTTLKQTQSSMIWLSSLTKVKKRFTHDTPTGQPIRDNSCVEYSRDDIQVIQREDDKSVPESDLERTLRNVRDFLRVLNTHTEQLNTHTEQRVASTREFRTSLRSKYSFLAV